MHSRCYHPFPLAASTALSDAFATWFRVITTRAAWGENDVAGSRSLTWLPGHLSTGTTHHPPTFICVAYQFIVPLFQLAHRDATRSLPLATSTSPHSAAKPEFQDWGPSNGKSQKKKLKKKLSLLSDSANNAFKARVCILPQHENNKNVPEIWGYSNCYQVTRCLPTEKFTSPPIQYVRTY